MSRRGGKARNPAEGFAFFGCRECFCGPRGRSLGMGEPPSHSEGSALESLRRDINLIHISNLLRRFVSFSKLPGAREMRWKP